MSLRGLPVAIATGGSIFLQIFFGESRTSVQIPAHLPDRRSGAVCGDFGRILGGFSRRYYAAFEAFGVQLLSLCIFKIL